MYTYFISGHRVITEQEFKDYYISKIDSVLCKDPDAEFVVGDYWGSDEMAQNYLIERGVSLDHITVYHMMTSPRYYNKHITRFVGGFQSDEERDCAMTQHSDFDIAYVREDKWKDSGTAQNIKRRNTM